MIWQIFGLQESHFRLGLFLICFENFFLVKSEQNSLFNTGKSFSDALMLASTNPQYDNKLSLIYQFSTWKLQAQNMLCSSIVLNVKTKTKKQFMYTTSEHVVYINCFEFQNTKIFWEKRINSDLSRSFFWPTLQKTCFYVHEKLQRNSSVGSCLKIFSFRPYGFDY